MPRRKRPFDAPNGAQPPRVRPNPARLPDRPLTAREVVSRFAAIHDFPDMLAAINELGPGGMRMMDAMHVLTARLLTEEEFTALMPHMLQVWYAFVPRGCTPDLRIGEMTASLREDLAAAAQPSTSKQSESRQPVVMEAVRLKLAQSADASEEGPLRAEAVAIMTFALKALVNELDFALRVAR